MATKDCRVLPDLVRNCGPTERGIPITLGSKRGALRPFQYLFLNPVRVLTG